MFGTTELYRRQNVVLASATEAGGLLCSEFSLVDVDLACDRTNSSDNVSATFEVSLSLHYNGMLPLEGAFQFTLVRKKRSAFSVSLAL